MDKRSYEKVLLGEFRRKEFVDALFQDIDYLSIPFNLKSIIIHISIFTIFSSINFLLRNFKINIPKGELFYASLLYGIFKVNKTRVVYGLYDSNRKSFGILANELRNIQFNAQYPAQLIKKNIDRIYTSASRQFVFGENDKELLMSIGYREENIIIAGSIFIDIFRKSEFFQEYQKEFDICILSNVTHEWVARNEKKIERKIIDHIKEYKTKNKDLKIVICGRPQAKKYETAGLNREYAFFENLIENYNAQFVKNIPEKYTTYITMLKSKIVIANSSNAAIEAIALGVKTMFYQPYEFFAPAPRNYIFTEKSLDYSNFESTLQKLIKIKDEDFEIIANDFKNKYIDNSSGHNLVNFRKSN